MGNDEPNVGKSNFGRDEGIALGNGTKMIVVKADGCPADEGKNLSEPKASFPRFRLGLGHFGNR